MATRGRKSTPKKTPVKSVDELRERSSVPEKPIATQGKEKSKIKVLFFLPDDASLSEMHLDEISKKIPSTKQADPLCLVIHSDGGNPFAAVKIMRLLKSIFGSVIALLPEKAYSAGALMTLGADELYMSVNACLGPLDLPMEHPQDGTLISALDVINASTTIATFVDEIAAKRFSDLRTNKKIRSRTEAAKIAYQSATESVLPILSKIDPYLTQKSYRELKIAWWYAYDLLIAGLMKNTPHLAWNTSKTLTTSFPAHEYAIFRDEAKKMLKLPVQGLENFSDWSLIKPDFDILRSAGIEITYKEL